MENRKRIGEISREFQFPEPIIHHIQSFLNRKQAAQTTVLSKLWGSAFSTRPNLDFDERNFDGNSKSDGRGDSKSASESRVSDEFVNFVNKSMLRYEESNLKIESLKLWIKSRDSYSISVFRELIVKALEMGANDLNLEFHIHFEKGTWRYVLPREVIKAEALIKLTLVGCKIDMLIDRKVCWPRLKSLSLCKVHMEDDEYIMWDIISDCPLIENLLLSDCRCLVQIPDYKGPGRELAFRSRPLNVESLVDVPLKVFEFHKLKCLLLEEVKIDSLFFNDFSLKYPCLEGLTLKYCTGYKDIDFSCHSLKFLSLAERLYTRTRMKFNLPGIRKFMYSGLTFPTLSVKPAMRDWESDISVTCWRQCYGVTFYSELKTFLRKLKSSNISLSLELNLARIVREVTDVKCLPKPVVENLMLSMVVPSNSRLSWEECSAVLDVVFLSCRPKFLTLYLLPTDMQDHQKNNEKLLQLLCKTLINQENQDFCTPNISVIGLRDLEEVNVEFFEENLSEWRPFLPWKTLLDASRSPEECRQQIRFRLGWGPT